MSDSVVQLAELLLELVRDDLESYASIGDTLSDDAGFAADLTAFKAAAIELVQRGLVRCYRWDALTGAYVEHDPASLAAEEIWLLAV